MVRVRYSPARTMMPMVIATMVDTAATESTLATLSTLPRGGAPDRPASRMLEMTDATVRTSTIAVDTNRAGVVRSFRISMLMSRLIAAPLRWLVRRRYVGDLAGCWQLVGRS